MCVCVFLTVCVCLCVCVCVRVSSIGDDWICQPAGTLITWAIFRLTSHNHIPISGMGMNSVIQEAAGRALAQSAEEI